MKGLLFGIYLMLVDLAIPLEIIDLSLSNQIAFLFYIIASAIAVTIGLVFEKK